MLLRSTRIQGAGCVKHTELGGYSWQLCFNTAAEQVLSTAVAVKARLAVVWVQGHAACTLFAGAEDSKPRALRVGDGSLSDSDGFGFLTTDSYHLQMRPSDGLNMFVSNMYVTCQR